MIDLKDAIRSIPDYPKPGIMFRDITTLLGDASAFRRTVDELVHPYAGGRCDKVAGIEARGFILGGAVAHQLSAGFVPIRKKGKLPHKTVRVSYLLEYGEDEIEMHADALVKGERVILVDDLVATGGTALAAADRGRGGGGLLRRRSAGSRRLREAEGGGRRRAVAHQLRRALTGRPGALQAPDL
jgi:adenine phosphoribosyltransferase